MESCIEWLERRIESDCKFFPVDKKDISRGNNAYIYFKVPGMWQ